MSNSKIMNEFWGLVSSHLTSFIVGTIFGILLILYMQNATDDEPQPGINISQPPQPGYIPQGLKP